MKYLLALLAFFFLYCGAAQAQDALVVQSCGTLPQQFSAGATRQLTVDVNGKLCGSGVLVNLTASVNPTVNNDSTQGYQVGSLWQNASTGQVWIARSVAVGAARWTMLELTDFTGYVVGNWVLPTMNGSYNAGNAPGSGIIKLVLGYVKERVTIGGLGVRVTTLSAAGNCQAAIYANNVTTGRPTGTAIVSSASLSTGATGAITTTNTTGGPAINTQLEPGPYWFAINCDNATVVLATLSVAYLGLSQTIGSATAGNTLTSSSGVEAINVTQTFGTWPDLTAASFSEGIGGNFAPLVMFNVTSVP